MSSEADSFLMFTRCDPHNGIENLGAIGLVEKKNAELESNFGELQWLIVCGEKSCQCNCTFWGLGSLMEALFERWGFMFGTGLEDLILGFFGNYCAMRKL